MTTQAIEKDNGKGKEQTTIQNVGTWNVVGPNRKEIHLSFEFKRTQLNILTIIKTKKKGQGKTETKEEYQ